MAFSASAWGSVAAGFSHSLVVTDTDNSWAWGSNLHGQLGNGGQTDRTTPGPVTGVDSVRALGGGEFHTVALLADRTVWTWGQGSRGQLGDGGTANRDTPAPIGGLSNVRAIAVGGNHALALLADRSVVAWGANDLGQLGDGTYGDRRSPVSVPGLRPVVAIAAGANHSLALKADGSVWVWGAGGLGQVGTGSLVDSPTPVRVPGLEKVDVIASGPAANHSFAVARDERVWAWGDNSSGQLGDGSTEIRPSPVEVGTLPGVQQLAAASATLSGVQQLAAGATHTVALKSDGSLLAWGSNSLGQLGTGTTEPALTPIPLAGPVGIVQVAAGQVHSLALSTDGQVFAWGDNAIGQIGNGTLDPVATPYAASESGFEWKTANPIFSVPSGTYDTDQTVALSSANSEATIRYTTNGVDPTESDPAFDPATPLLVNTPVTFKARAWAPDLAPSDVVEAAYSFQAAAPVPNPPAGSYAGPRLVGLGSATPSAEIRYTTDGSDPTPGSTLFQGPILVEVTTTIKATAYRPGWSDSGSIAATYTIMPPAGSVKAGERFSLALDPGGRVWAWGANDQGQLGDGTTTDRTSPVEVQGLTNIVAIAAGGSHALALRSDRTVWSWGANAQGQLGDGTDNPRNVPARVPVLGDVVAIAAGATHSVALTRDGRLWTWGGNASGQLGDDTTIAHSQPATLANPADVIGLAAGEGHSLALTVSGRVWSWGANHAGQIGDGSFDEQHHPVLVVTLSGIVSIAAGHDHSLAVKADGSGWAWGANTTGQLGDRTLENQAIPVPFELSRACPSEDPDCEGTILIPVRQEIAGGSAHSLGVAEDRTTWAWGANDIGQLGLGIVFPEMSAPAQIPTLADVIGVSAGEDHSLALSAEGVVYAWGGNGRGQLGDGSTAARSAPFAVSEAGFLWKLVAPRFNPPGGTYASVLSVAISSPTVGASIHYTMDGTDPTEASPLYSGPVAIQVATFLQAKAFKPGWKESETTSDFYDLNFGTLARPSADPPSRLAVTSLAVSLRAAPGDTIRYTLDGTHPHEESPIYEGPIQIETTGTLFARAFRQNWTPSTLLEETYQIHVATPVLAPGPGTYPVGNTITVTSPTPGATLHYTTDGHDPTEADPVIASGSTLAVGTFRLKVRGWKPGCTPSGIRSATYAVVGDPNADQDQDGLTNAQESLYGADPDNPDTNGDGITDGAAVALGLSPTNMDMDVDGVTNPVEIAQGTDPFDADTDDDGSSDGTDCFPLDTSRAQCPLPDPNDKTPPVISLQQPSTARLISSTP